MKNGMAPAFEVVDEGDGIVRVAVSASIVRRPVAEALCADISRVARRSSGARLLLDLGALQKATPGAGLYAFRRIKELDLSAIALYRGNRFMRSFAGVVMRLARFPTFEFFDDEASAREWLSDDGPGRSSR